MSLPFEALKQNFPLNQLFVRVYKTGMLAIASILEGVFLYAPYLPRRMAWARARGIMST
jgi:hypothetical protein